AAKEQNLRTDNNRYAGVTMRRESRFRAGSVHRSSLLWGGVNPAAIKVRCEHQYSETRRKDKYHEIDEQADSSFATVGAFFHSVCEGARRYWEQENQRFGAGAHRLFDGHAERRTLAARQSFG